MRIQEEESGSWDLTPVINLVYALTASRRDDTTSQSQQSKHKAASLTLDTSLQEGHRVRLGNFDDLWRFLDQPLDVPPPVISPQVTAHNPETTTRDPEATTRETRTFSVDVKGVHWQDEVGGIDRNGSGSVKNSDGASDRARLTKTQRKKDKRRQRKSWEAEAARPSKISPECSHTESDVDTNDTVQRSDDRRAIIQHILNGYPVNTAVVTEHSNLSRKAAGQPLANYGTSGSCVLPPTQPSTRHVQSYTPLDDRNLAVAAAKKEKLMAKLSLQFIDERQFLSNFSLMQHSDELGAQLQGIHVFVDISNILIGFHDALKMARGLSVSVRIRRQPLSFHNLSLVLERGRPAAKRVLVGSDNFESIQEAKLIGYETNILERVHKAKDITPRQNRYRNANASPGQSSGSETTARLGPEKWVEQAVDEILHLKILESVIDAKQPSTIVLATGDAAEAEYSGGFLKMVDRALQKGWKVELVSFKHNTSNAYLKRDFRSRWGGSFKTIELDEFAEELLGV